MHVKKREKMNQMKQTVKISCSTIMMYKITVEEKIFINTTEKYMQKIESEK